MDERSNDQRNHGGTGPTTGAASESWPEAASEVASDAIGHVVVVPFGRRRATAPAEPVVEVDAEIRLRHPSAGARPSLRIDCAECVMEGTDACSDCVVSFVVGREPGDALVVDVEEARAVRILADAGLLPTLRHRRRASGDE
ncbi:MAG: hypothetical protein ACKOZL_06660 [Actinomycetes bacterium]